MLDNGIRRAKKISGSSRVAHVVIQPTHSRGNRFLAQACQGKENRTNKCQSQKQVQDYHTTDKKKVNTCNTHRKRKEDKLLEANIYMTARTAPRPKCMWRNRLLNCYCHSLESLPCQTFVSTTSSTQALCSHFIFYTVTHITLRLHPLLQYLDSTLLTSFMPLSCLLPYHLHYHTTPLLVPKSHSAISPHSPFTYMYLNPTKHKDKPERKINIQQHLT